MELDARIEAVLFYKAEPVKKATLAELFDVSAVELDVALTKLGTTLAQRGVRLIVTDAVAELVTAPEVAELIETMRKEELSADIGKAGAETLSIILYRGPLSRAEIDRIRGVNSTFILRNLLIRGLIERRQHPTDARSFVYAPTTALFAHLGITKREELPGFADVMNTLDTFEREQTAVEAVEEAPTPTQ